MMFATIIATMTPKRSADLPVFLASVPIMLLAWHNTANRVRAFSPEDWSVMRRLFLVLMLTFTSAVDAAEIIRPFVSGSLAQILAAREDRPFILVFWSLECQYCPTELKMLGALKQLYPKLEVVLVATDTPNDIPQLAARVKSSFMRGRLKRDRLMSPLAGPS